MLAPSGLPLVNVPIGALTGLTLSTLAGDDHVAVDFSNGAFVAGAMLDLDFGTQTLGDLLVLTGTSPTSLPRESFYPGTMNPGVGPYASGDGTVLLYDAASGVRTIRYTGLENPVDDEVPVGRLTVIGTANADQISLGPSPGGTGPSAAADERIAIATRSGIDFIHKTTVDIAGLAGHDTLDVSAYTTDRSLVLTGTGAADGFNGTVTSLSGGFTNLDAFVARPGGSDTISGLNADYHLGHHGHRYRQHHRQRQRPGRRLHRLRKPDRPVRQRIPSCCPTARARAAGWTAVWATTRWITRPTRPA